MRKIRNRLLGGRLSKKRWTQVVPMMANEREGAIVHEPLPTKSKFFAKLRKDLDMINVYVQINGKGEYLPLEKISKNWFFNYYSILE